MDKVLHLSMSGPVLTTVASPTAPASPAPRVRPELLAPAGDWDCVRAAVENGADAIYFGLERFNARMRAKNFTQADLPALMAFLHRRGVRGYVTFNTLVFTSELPDAADYLRGIIAAGLTPPVVIEPDKLYRFPGIGKRTAERIVLELKDKLPVVVGPASGGSAADAHAAPARGGQAQLVERALVEMGFRPPEAERATAALGDKVDTAPLPELVRLALAHLVR